MKEIKVYAINIEEVDEDFRESIAVIGISSVADWEFIQIAKEQCNWWSLKDFEEAFNNVEIATDMFYIRILEK
jgi:hypothetical protein